MGEESKRDRKEGSEEGRRVNRTTSEDLPFDDDRVNTPTYKEEPPYSPLEKYLETDKEIEGKRDAEIDRIRDKEDREDDI